VKILIAIDSSPHTPETLRLGAQLVRRAGEPPTVLTVVGRRSDDALAAAHATLACACRILGPGIPNIQTRVRVGDAAEEILEEAQAGHYRLIILGERQDRRQAPRLLQRSTMLRVVEFAPCSVIVSKGQVHPIRRILLCDSGAECPATGLGTDPCARSTTAAPPTLSCFTVQLADLLERETEVTVLHVMSQMSAGPGVRGQQLRADAQELIREHTPEGELLARDIQALQHPGIHPRPKVRHGLVVDEILQDVQSENYDLVVIGAHRGERWQRFLLDDLAHQIVLGLDRPVLVVR